MQNVMQALYLTRNARGLPASARRYTYALFEDKRKGKLAPGYLADIVVLDRDIRAVPAEQLEQTDVTVTIKSGSVLHSRQ